VKERPCALVAAIKVTEDGSSRVLVMPITHSAPKNVEAIEIPRPIKERLGLDAERSWIVLSEANEFIWPGPDVRPVPGGDLATIAYGFLPPRFFATIRARIIAIVRQGRTRRVPRSE
jgi:hypothetical protein